MSHKYLRVVAVDDSRTATLGMVKILSGIEGVELVGTASNGAEAIQVIEDVQPDVVLLDMVMPNLSGLDVLRTVRVRAPDTRVVMVTSSAGSKEEDEALRLGAAHVLGKPVDRERLAAILEVEQENAARR